MLGEAAAPSGGWEAELPFVRPGGGIGLGSAWVCGCGRELDLKLVMLRERSVQVACNLCGDAGLSEVLYQLQP